MNTVFDSLLAIVENITETIIMWYHIFISNTYQLVWYILISNLLLYQAVHICGRHCR